MGQNKPIHTGLKSSPDQRGWVVQLGFLDSSWSVLPCLKIGVNRSCLGLDRRGVRVTRGGKRQLPLDCSAYTKD